MNVYLTNRKGQKRQIHGVQAKVVAGVLIFLTPFMVLLGLAVMLLPIAAVFSLIIGLVMGFASGWNIFSIGFTIAGAVILLLTRIKITHS